MLRTQSSVEREFVRNDSGEIVGVRPVSVKERMVYSEGGMAVPFYYDTNTHQEADVDGMLDQYPTAISRLFKRMMSYFSRQVWRGEYG